MGYYIFIFSYVSLQVICYLLSYIGKLIVKRGELWYNLAEGRC